LLYVQQLSCESLGNPIVIEPKVPDQQLVATAIAEACAQVAKQEYVATTLHSLLQRTVAQMSGRFALSAVTEYVLPKFRGERDGHLDVVWMYGSIPVVAFEIDSSHRTKSLKKLLAINANLRFWIYFGASDGESFARSIDPVGIIHVIHLSASPHKQDGQTEIANCEPNGTADGLAKNQEASHGAKGFAKIRERYRNAYVKWTPEDDHWLQRQYDEGVGVGELARYFQRQPSAIHSRLRKLGLH
jgi:hypothetical protein